MNIPSVIKELRLKNGYTQSELAEKLCVSQNTVSQWESGKREIDYDSLQQLLLLSNEELSLKSKEPHGRLYEVGGQADVRFYRDSANRLFQQVRGWSTVRPIATEPTWEEVDSVEQYTIKYDLTGEHGFSIWEGEEGIDEEMIDNDFWDLDQVSDHIYECLPLYCHCCDGKIDGFAYCDHCSMITCLSCLVDFDDPKDEAICVDCDGIDG